MSRCRCDSPRNFRVTGEVWPRDSAGRVIGSGEKAVRVRCANCGGKVGLLGSDVLTDLLGIPEDEIQNGACLAEANQRTVTVDLI